MSEKEEKIKGAIENVPAIYGLDASKNKVRQIAASKAELQINRIFAPDSPLTQSEKELELSGFVEDVKIAIAGKQKWYQIKTHKGKTDKSRRCKIDIYKGDPDPEYIYDGRPYEKPELPEKGTSTFFAPTSMIYVDAEGQSWLPVFFVRKKLTELQERASYIVNKYDRVPVKDAAWPGAVEYLNNLIGLLPTDEEIQAAAEARKIAGIEWQKKQEEWQKKQEKEQELKQKRKNEAAKRAEKSKKAKLARRAKQEQVHGVDVEVEYWDTGDGNYVKKSYELENVSLFYVGETQVEIVEENGRETRKKRDNVRVISPLKE